MATRVLVPLDGSAFSRQILPYVRRLLRPGEHELTLLRVAAPPETPRPEGPSTVSIEYLTMPVRSPAREGDRAAVVDPAHIAGNIVAALEDEMQEDVYYLQAAGFAATVEVRFGDPAAEIIRIVEDRDVGVVAMATHGRTGLRRLVLGSVAEQVLRRLTVPVLLVRPFDQPRDVR
jgi:nucleotide-binding universal stress UspA family protein